MFIGIGGYKGFLLEGIVDIGYEIVFVYCNRGLVMEVVKLLMQYVLQQKEVQCVQVYILVGLNGFI